jgi:hypothetical protein
MPKSTLYTPTGQCCELDEPYQAPIGYFDQPFIYVYNADNPNGDGIAIPNGQDRRRAQITTFTGSDFILRRVAGIDRVCTQFQLRDVLSRFIFDTEVGATFRDFPLVPEALWPGGTGISFDLLNVQKGTGGNCGQFLSQILFQGVRRYKGYRRPPSYPYWEDPYTYVAEDSPGTGVININWGPNDAPRRFAIEIYDNDFELLRILETIDFTKAPGGPLLPPNPTSNVAVKMQLFDQVNEEVFSAPVIDDLMMDNSNTYQGIVPVPGIVYRIGQAIRFELTSLFCPGGVNGGGLSLPIQLKFEGVRRRPC